MDAQRTDPLFSFFNDADAERRSSDQAELARDMDRTLQANQEATEEKSMPRQESAIG